VYKGDGLAYNHHIASALPVSHGPRAITGRSESDMRRICLIWLAALLMLPGAPPAAAQDIRPVEAQGPPSFTAYPALDAAGFLALEWPEPEFVHADEEAGYWLYLSSNLRVEISRYTGSLDRRALVWFMADIHFREGQAFRAYPANPKNPARAQARPARIARDNQVVYAQNGDLFSYRVYNKLKTGLIIRDGRLLYQDTFTKPRAAIPPLDELALYPDGRVEMRTPGILSAQDYLDLGARDVLAFGPILFKDRVKDDRLDISFTHREPRSALGVVGPGHLVGILVEGRNKRSAGANLQFVADRLLEWGCVEAFTLDGGQTAAMVFMGQEVMDPGIYHGFQQARKQQDIIGIGVSHLVAP